METLKNVFRGSQKINFAPQYLEVWLPLLISGVPRISLIFILKYGRNKIFWNVINSFFDKFHQKHVKKIVQIFCRSVENFTYFNRLSQPLGFKLDLGDSTFSFLCRFFFFCQFVPPGWDWCLHLVYQKFLNSYSVIYLYWELKQKKHLVDE